MTHDDLVQKLRATLQAHDGKAYPSLHLFGIRFSDELKGHNLSLICEDAGVSKSYGTEVSKGRKLAPWVELKS